MTRWAQSIGLPSSVWVGIIQSTEGLCCAMLNRSVVLESLQPPWTVCSPPGSSVHGDFPGKNIGVGFHALLQGIFSTLRSNLGLLHWQAESLPVELLGKPVSCITTLLTLLYVGRQPPLLSTAIIPLLGLLLLYLYFRLS